MLPAHRERLRVSVRQVPARSPQVTPMRTASRPPGRQSSCLMTVLSMFAFSLLWLLALSSFSPSILSMLAAVQSPAGAAGRTPDNGHKSPLKDGHGSEAAEAEQKGVRGYAPAAASGSALAVAKASPEGQAQALSTVTEPTLTASPTPSSQAAATSTGDAAASVSAKVSLPPSTPATKRSWDCTGPGVSCAQDVVVRSSWFDLRVPELVFLLEMPSHHFRTADGSWSFFVTSNFSSYALLVPSGRTGDNHISDSPPARLPGYEQSDRFECYLKLLNMEQEYVLSTYSKLTHAQAVAHCPLDGVTRLDFSTRVDTWPVTGPGDHTHALATAAEGLRPVVVINGEPIIPRKLEAVWWTPWHQPWPRGQLGLQIGPLSDTPPFLLEWLGYQRLLGAVLVQGYAQGLDVNLQKAVELLASNTTSAQGHPAPGNHSMAVDLVPWPRFLGPSEVFYGSQSLAHVDGMYRALGRVEYLHVSDSDDWLLIPRTVGPTALIAVDEDGAPALGSRAATGKTYTNVLSNSTVAANHSSKRTVAEPTGFSSYSDLLDRYKDACDYCCAFAWVPYYEDCGVSHTPVRDVVGGADHPAAYVLHSAVDFADPPFEQVKSIVRTDRLAEAHVHMLRGGCTRPFTGLHIAHVRKRFLPPAWYRQQANLTGACAPDLERYTGLPPSVGQALAPHLQQALEEQTREQA